MVEALIVGVIVFAASAYLLRLFLRMWRGRGGGCHCSASEGCSAAADKSKSDKSKPLA